MYAQPVVKTIGTNGQISLGKQYAGQQVLIEEQEAGVWLIRTADIIPHNERWLHEPDHKAKLEAAVCLDDVRVPPANRLEALKGNRAGQHSIRINDQWRVCFVWRDGAAWEVEIVDYH